MIQLLKIGISLCVMLLVWEGTPASAQQVSIDSGVTYLRSTQSPDGSWGGTATSLNTVFQTTTTTARTFQLLSPTDHPALTNAIAFLSIQTPNTVDDLARQLEVLAVSGAAVTNLVATLKAAQQTNGGWGIDLDKTFPSEVIDTLSALRGLSAANAADTTTVSSALGSLLGNQNVDGGWGTTRGQPSEVFYTALVLLVLKDFQTAFNLSASIVAASDFLIGQQNIDGSFGTPAGTAFETALALQAMLRFVVDPAKISNAANYLVLTQTATGSWAEDAYSTALAIRALSDSQVVARSIDNDGDGFTEQQGDCNDTNPSVFPGAADLTVNGIDEDCNGIDGPPAGTVDADGDGFTPIQGDCDDTNPNVFPGAVDIPNNGIDEDCDGQDAVSTVQITSVNLFKVVDGAQIATTLFGAFEVMAFEVSVTDPNVLLTLFVTDPTGQVLNVRNEAGAFRFDTINHVPGEYTVTVRALDTNRGLILDQTETPFTIQPVIRLADAVLAVTPSLTHVGAAETVNVDLLFNNRSNINTIVTLTIVHEVKSPSGTVLSSGATPRVLLPELISTNVTLATFAHTFTESGDHPVQVNIFNGTQLIATVNSTISVAPVIRVDPSMTLTPGTVPPDGDKRIRIEIRLQGVEDIP